MGGKKPKISFPSPPQPDWGAIRQNTLTGLQPTATANLLAAGVDNPTLVALMLAQAGVQKNPQAGTLDQYLAQAKQMLGLGPGALGTVPAGTAAPTTGQTAGIRGAVGKAPGATASPFFGQDETGAGSAII